MKKKRRKNGKKFVEVENVENINENAFKSSFVS